MATVEKMGSKREWVAVDLTPEEILVRGRELAEVEHKIELSEMELAEARESHKERMKEYLPMRSNLAQQIRRGAQDREVDVEVWADFVAQRVSYNRTDTGEVIRDRGMTPEERQQRLFPIDVKVSDARSRAAGDGSED